MQTPSTTARSVPKVEPKAFLGFIPVHLPSWEVGVSQVLLHLLEGPAHALATFPALRALTASHAQALRDTALSDAKWKGISTTGLLSAYPLATALLSLSPNDSTPIHRTLLRLAVELHLRGLPDQQMEALCVWIRGLGSQRESGALARSLGGCDGLRALQVRVAHLRARADNPRSITGYEAFDRSWNAWLGPAIARLLMLADKAEDEDEGDSSPEPLSDRSTAPPSALAGPFDEPDIEPAYTFEPVAKARARDGLPNRLAAAIGKELQRRTSPELLRSPDSILPTEVARADWLRCVALTEHALARAELSTVESTIAYLLAIEAGLTLREAHVTVIAPGPAIDLPMIDLACGALRRPESRPPSAYHPGPNAMDLWLPCGGDVLFPLSPECQRLARALLELRQKQGAGSASTLLLSQRLKDDPDGARADAASRARALPEVEPTRSATRGTYRRRLAACLAESLGPDAAQIAFGDSFGASTAPTYYATFSTAAIAGAIVKANQPVTGQDPVLAGPLLDQCQHMVGSRVRPRTGTLSETWEAVGVHQKRARGRPSSAGALDALRRRRDSLAAHFMLATGHRPHQSIGLVRLTDMLPAQAMAVIRDKRTDPARLTRLVGTGRLFIGALEGYVAELRRFAADVSQPGPARAVVREVLGGDAGLFRLPDSSGQPEDLEIQALLSRLPAVWHERPNLHRHALNQALIEAGIDPEDRYFQMGWLEGDVHAVSDMAPYAPMALGPRLADAIDHWLASQGWAGGMEPTASASSLCLLPLKDFDADLSEHRAEALQRQHELRQALATKRREVTPIVLQLLMLGLHDHAPNLSASLPRGDTGPLHLARATGSKSKPDVPRQTVDAILSRLHGPGHEPIHAYLGARLLSGALARAVKQGECTASLPPVHHPNFKSVPSPFVPGLGHAVALAQALKDALLVGAAGRLDGGWVRWRAHICVWAVMAYTPYRRLADATRLVLKAGDATHSKAQGWLLRVPFGTGHAVVTGPVALLLNRLRQENGWRDAVAAVHVNGSAEMGRFLAEALPKDLTQGVSATSLQAWMMSALRVAGAFELCGPERLVMECVVEPGTAAAERVSAAEDGVTIAGPASSADMPESDEDSPELSVPAPSRSSANADRPLRALMSAFHPAYAGLIGGKPADPPSHRIAQLLPAVRELQRTMDPAPTLARLLLDYVHSLMTEGGPKSRGGMAASSIHTTYFRIAPALDAIPAHTDMREMDGATLTGVLMTAVARSRIDSKHKVLADLDAFIRFCSRRHPIDEPDWGALYAASGTVMKGGDPAIVSDEEARDIIEALRRDLEAPELESAGPVDRRLRELCFASALLLEASGVRPQSLYGLTLADFHLGNAGDFIHLRGSGWFAEVKTQTSVGFVPLEGTLWRAHRAWFVRWIEAFRGRQAEADWIKTPLFFEPSPSSEPRRFRRSDVAGRIGELVRWRTRQPKGRAYWLRKRRINERHRAVRQSTTAKARDIYRTLKTCGHATISTPLTSYIGNPLSWAELGPALDMVADKRSAASFAGISEGAIEQRWIRAACDQNSGPDGLNTIKLSKALNLAAPNRDVWELGEPPAAPSTREGLDLWVVEEVMHRIATGADIDWISQNSGVHRSAVENISTACRELSARTGLELSARGLCRPRQRRIYIDLITRLSAMPEDAARVSAEWVACARIPCQEDAICLVDASVTETLAEALARSDFIVARMTTDSVRLQSRLHRSSLYGAKKALLWSLATIWIGKSLGGSSMSSCRDS